MRLSIITVCYNDLPGLIRTHKSILSQSTDNLDLEWVIIDGLSTDGTCKYLTKLTESLSETNITHFKYISEKDHGIYDAMNKGTNLATGEIIQFLNAGDSLEQNALANIEKPLTENNFDVLALGASYIYPKKNEKERVIYRAPKNINHVKYGVISNHQATIYKRFTLLKHPYPDNYKMCGDYWLIATLYNEGCKIKIIDIPFAKFFIGGSSTTKYTKVVSEAADIQKAVFNMSPLKINWYSLRRMAVMTTNFLIYKLSNFL